MNAVIAIPHLVCRVYKPGQTESLACKERLCQEKKYCLENEVWHGNRKLLRTRAESHFSCSKFVFFNPLTPTFPTGSFIILDCTWPVALYLALSLPYFCSVFKAYWPILS